VKQCASCATTSHRACNQYNLCALPSCYCSQYHAAFGDPNARDLALATFRGFDDAWHTPAYGGYIETASNGFPQDLKPSSNSSTNSSGNAPDEAAILEAVNATGLDPASAGEVVSANRSSRPDDAGSVGLNATGDGTRSLNVLMHGAEALLALHRATNGESDVSLLGGFTMKPSEE
jgi:hypothetical protein